VSWYKQEGEAVAQGEPLYVIETDKASLDVEAPASGILCGVTAQPGDEVKALSAIAVIEDEIEASVEAEAKTDSTLTSALTSTLASRLLVSPRARRLAERAGVPLAAVKPTGPQGAIIERDVRAYLVQAEAQVKVEAKVEQPEATARTASTSALALTSITPVARRIAEEAGLDLSLVTGTGPRGQVTKEDVARVIAQASEPARAQKIYDAGEQGQPPASSRQLLASSLPLTGVRAIIAERMAASHSQTAPVTLTAEADAKALVELRKQLAADGVAVSYNDLLLSVLARALREHPRLNASLDGDTIRLWPRVDIGLAVDTERGLLAPVVRDVASKGLAQLAAETKALIERAQVGRCAPAELTGGTFTLTNLGMFGIDAFTPLINQPETAILGVGRIKARPVVVGDQIVARPTVWLSLTFDHRLVDGGPAARFLQRVVQLVERPHLLMA
jgi:pyruvate dehydrogenase E2 component (dihydrolipoamide acetyltransferase)